METGIINNQIDKEQIVRVGHATINFESRWSGHNIFSDIAICIHCWALKGIVSRDFRRVLSPVKYKQIHNTTEMRPFSLTKVNYTYLAISTSLQFLLDHILFSVKNTVSVPVSMYKQRRVIWIFGFIDTVTEYPASHIRYPAGDQPLKRPDYPAHR